MCSMFYIYNIYLFIINLYILAVLTLGIDWQNIVRLPGYEMRNVKSRTFRIVCQVGTAEKEQQAMLTVPML